MSTTFYIKDNHIRQASSALEKAKHKALEIIGQKAEKYAKALCPVGTVESTGKKGYRGDTLRNSITHQVEDDVVAVGTNVEYAPYVELGTGPNFTPPPSWETFGTTRGVGTGHGYVKSRPFLRPAIEDHVDEYKTIMETELKNA